MDDSLRFGSFSELLDADADATEERDVMRLRSGRGCIVFRLVWDSGIVR